MIRELVKLVRSLFQSWKNDPVRKAAKLFEGRIISGKKADVLYGEHLLGCMKAKMRQERREKEEREAELEYQQQLMDEMYG